MYTLSYSKITSKSVINKIDIKKHSQLIDFIDEMTIGRKGQCIWVIAKDGLSDVFVSDSALNIQFFIEKMPLFRTVGNYYLFECESFEDAYKLATDMNEQHPMCYPNEQS